MRAAQLQLIDHGVQAQVCLSLLGTWHGGAASEKWNPDTSGIFQILLSVQVRQTHWFRSALR